MTEERATSRRGQVLGAIGLVVGLVVGGTGAAVGAALVTSKDIKDDTIKRVDMNFETGQEAALLTGPVILSKDQEKIVSTTLTIDDGGGSGIAHGFVELRNRTPNPVTVAVGLVHTEEPSHNTSVTTTLKVGESKSVPIGLQCNGMPAGEQTVKLTAGGAADVVVESAFLSVMTGPEI
jgi:hypothetical protein